MSRTREESFIALNIPVVFVRSKNPQHNIMVRDYFEVV